MGKMMIVWLLLVATGFVGWVLNLVALFNSSFTPITGHVVLRVIGVFVAPVGSILGFFF